MSLVPVIACNTAAEVRALCLRHTRKPDVPVVRFGRKEQVKAQVDTAIARAKVDPLTPIPDSAAACSRIIERMWRAPVSTRITMSMIMRATCEECGIALADLCSRSRLIKFVRVRHAVFVLAKELTNFSLPYMASRVGGRDHTTAINSIKKGTVLLNSDVDFALRVARVRRRLRGAA